MQRQTKNNPITHLHYHYHYYNPNQALASPSKTMDETLSKSVIYERKREDSFDSTPQTGRFKLHTQGCQTAASQKWPKMRSSEILNNKSQDQLPFHDQFSNLKVRYVMEQELHQNGQERESNKNTSFTELERPKTTVVGKQSVQNNLVAYYEQEVRKYRSQIERLKMVEEECVYLRETFYNHYDEKCNGK